MMFQEQDLYRYACHPPLLASLIGKLNSPTSYLSRLRLQRLVRLFIQRRLLSFLQPQALRNLVQPRLLLVRRRIAEHFVHVLKTLSHCLGNDEPCEEERNERKGREEQVRAVADRLQHIRRHKTDDEVTHPGRRCCQRHSLGTVADVVDLRGENPANGRPGVREVHVVNIHEGDTGPSSGRVVFQGVTVSANDCTDDDERNEGTSGAREEEGSSANSVDQEERWECRKRIHDA